MVNESFDEVGQRTFTREDVNTSGLLAARKTSQDSRLSRDDTSPLNPSASTRPLSTTQSELSENIRRKEQTDSSKPPLKVRNIVVRVFSNVLYIAWDSTEWTESAAIR